MRWNLLLVAVMLSIVCLLVASCTDDNPDSGKVRPGGDTSNSQSVDDMLEDE